jgi:hypothetical protein
MLAVSVSSYQQKAQTPMTDEQSPKEVDRRRDAAPKKAMVPPPNKPHAAKDKHKQGPKPPKQRIQRHQGR